MPERDLFQNNLPICLASASPRRRDLLGSLGLEFEIYWPRQAELGPEPNEEPAAYASRVAEAKAGEAALRPEHKGALIIAADTIVCIEKQIFGKPANLDEALAMLLALNGRKHRVFTAVALIHPDSSRKTSTEMTEVHFANWPKSVLQAYLAAANPLDKAGAYGIQDQGQFLVSRLTGSYTNVVGLPLSALTSSLLEMNAIRPA